MQRSIKGLSRSLLYAILEQAPELIESTFPRQWEKLKAVPWNTSCHVDLSRTDLQQAFRTVISTNQTYQSRRFCFFIGGLDEYDEKNGLDPGDSSCYTDVINFLFGWTQSRPEVKICVSSRDWNLFDAAFSEYPKLRLQDLTIEDIRRLAISRLVEMANEPLSESSLVLRWELADTISRKAEGVFLWAVLVLQSL